MPQACKKSLPVNHKFYSCSFFKYDVVCTCTRMNFNLEYVRKRTAMFMVFKNI